MKSNSSILFHLFLVLGDFLALVTAFVAAYILRVSVSDKAITNTVDSSTYLQAFLAILPLWILVFALLGLYSNRVYEKRFSELGRLFVGSVFGLLAIVFINFLSVEPIFPAKLVPIYAFLLSFVFLVLFRALARGIRGALFVSGFGVTNILLVGNTAISDELLERLYPPQSGYHVLGVVGDKRRSFHADFVSFDEALKSLEGRRLHGIVQTELYADEQRNQELLEYAQTNHLSYRFVPGNTELFVGNIEVDLFQSVPVIAIHQTALLGWGRVAKRIFDILFGSILLALFSPIMIVVALLVKLTDASGPIFLRQERLTRFDQVFTVFKFRTHYAKYSGKSDEEVFAMVGKPELIEEYRANGDQLQHDFRVTPFGAFLRKTSLDELPQLINVVRGDISLVGPRALVPQELANYKQKHAILSVKSGVTGLAQVSGRRNISFDERRKLDLYYVQNWSFWMDISILLRTLRAVIGGRGAK